MDTTTKALSKVWLVLGLLQMILVLQGCNGGASSDDQLLSSTQNKSPETSNTNAAVNLPTRLSLAFFERSLTGSVKVDGQEVQSDVNWQENIPAANSRTGDVIMNVTDHQGCAVYTNAAGVSLCFNIQGDVSSVALSARDLSVQGGCNGKFENPRFVQATKESGVVNVLFQGTCNGQGSTIEFQLKQI